VFSVAFSPDGSQMMTGSGDKTAILWDTATGKQIHKFEGHADQVRTVLFRPRNDQHVLTTSNDVTAILWDKDTGQQIRKFEDLNQGHRGGILTAMFNSDGTKLLTGSKNGTAILWDVETSQLIRKFSGHKDMVFSVAFSPDASQILTGGGDALAILWNADTGEKIHTFAGRPKSTSASSQMQNIVHSPNQRMAPPLKMGSQVINAPALIAPEPPQPAFESVNLLPGVDEPQQAPSDFLQALKRTEDEIKEKEGFAVAGQIYIDGEPVKLSSDFGANVIGRPTYHFKNGWFLTSIFNNTDSRDKTIKAFALQTGMLEIPIPPEDKKVNFYKVLLKKAPDDQLVDLKGRVMSEDNQPLKNAGVSLGFSIGSGTYPSGGGNTNWFNVREISTDELGQYCIPKVFPREYSVTAWHNNFVTGSNTFDPNENTIDDHVLSKHRKVTIDVIYQPDGSTDFTNENVKKGQFVLTTGNWDTANWDNPIGGSSLRLDSNSKMSSWGHDFRFDVDRGHVEYTSNYGGVQGLYDLGEVDFNSVTEAKPDLLKGLYPRPSCELNHVYVIRTFETQETGNYAKLIVRKIEVIEPEEK